MFIERDGDGVPRSSTPSPMSPPSWRPAARWTPKPGAAARPSTPRTGGFRCTRKSSAKRPAACCRTRICSAFVWDFELDADAEVHVRSGAPGAGPQPGQTQLQGRPGRPGRRHRHARSAAAQGSGAQTGRTGTPPRRGQPEHAGAGDRQQLPDGGYRIVAAPQLPVEDWNAQISLMTGMAAARLMLDGKVGILRTMPAPDERSLQHFRRQTRGPGQAVGRRSELRRIPADP